MKTSFWMHGRHRSMAVAYIQTGNEREALRHMATAFRHGYPIDGPQEHDDRAFFGTVWPELRRIYAKERKRYLSKLDIALRDQVLEMKAEDQAVRFMLRDSAYFSKKDSLRAGMATLGDRHMRCLKEVVAQKGWPGDELIGDSYTTGISGMRGAASLLVIHSYEADNLHFLPHAKRAAARNRTTWMDPEIIMINLLWRFEHQHGHVKMREVCIRKNGNLNERKSFFQIGTLAKFLNDNPGRKIRLFPTAYTPAEAKSRVGNVKALHQMKEILTELGIRADRVQISDSVRIVSNDGLGRHRVAFNYVR